MASWIIATEDNTVTVSYIVSPASKPRICGSGDISLLRGVIEKVIDIADTHDTIHLPDGTIALKQKATDLKS